MKYINWVVNKHTATFFIIHEKTSFIHKYTLDIFGRATL